MEKTDKKQFEVIGWTDWGNHKDKQNDDRYKSEIIQAIVDSLRRNSYKFTGDYHQNGECGVPILNDYTICCYGKRDWGSIMAKAYPQEVDDHDGYGYCRWAWDTSENFELQRLPIDNNCMTDLVKFKQLFNEMKIGYTVEVYEYGRISLYIDSDSGCLDQYDCGSYLKFNFNKSDGSFHNIYIG